MASTEHDYEIAMLRKQLARDRAQGNVRTIWTRGRTLEASVHGQQLTIAPDPNSEMRDPATGKFYHVDGYSKISGDGSDGDPVRP